ncbi:hypothetical protein E6Q11_02580 [Candidatus Dojkabacteria bacterium]|uniref:Uncharacterized protein n=1 Tax=Candidatus Dojkabacteria bacterium TaxID=2099670 RepID=A0A5C7J7S4_9BACT|nr:MAG: hypothetical protein E6Q11_02580 [Candidatus Dojkabacteria bacterium]
MATRRYKLSVGEGEFSVTEEVGSAVNSDTVEVTVELAATAVNITGGQRQILKAEVLDCLKKIQNHITKGNWPPA